MWGPVLYQAVIEFPLLKSFLVSSFFGATALHVNPGSNSDSKKFFFMVRKIDWLMVEFFHAFKMDCDIS